MDETLTESLIWAGEIRSCQGTHECEVSFGGEADLHQHKKHCKKNPGHSEFIKIADFSISKLPDRFQDAQLVDLIRVISELTVKITVCYTSENRPSVFPDSEIPYPFFTSGGSDKFSRTGTGKCVDFYKRVDEDNELCPCRLCQESGKPVKTWAAVIIHTATHVVFDNSEARRAKCWVCYDAEGEKPELLEAIDVIGGRADVSGDRCLLRCVTHNMGVADAVYAMTRIYRELFQQVKERYRVTPQEGSQRLVAVVSHPHGCAKHISLGECTETWRGDSRTVQYTYTAATCPGSSGAPVMVLGLGSEWWNHTHSGANSKGNVSSTIFIQE